MILSTLRVGRERGDHGRGRGGTEVTEDREGKVGMSGKWGWVRRRGRKQVKDCLVFSRVE